MGEREGMVRRRACGGDSVSSVNADGQVVWLGLFLWVLFVRTTTPEKRISYGQSAPQTEGAKEQALCRCSLRHS